MILSSIPGGFKLDQPAALSWARTVAAGNPGGIRETYRTYAEQAARRAYYLADRRRHPFALPAGQSKHEDGTAVDALPPSTTWLVKHGAEYGWRQTNTKESWHWEYFPELDTNAHAADIAALLEGTEMRVIASRDGRRAEVGEFTFKEFTNFTHASHESHIWESAPGSSAEGEPLVVDAETYDLARGYQQQRLAEYAATMAALMKVAPSDADSIVTKVVAAIKGLSWSAK